MFDEKFELNLKVFFASTLNIWLQARNEISSSILWDSALRRSRLSLTRSTPPLKTEHFVRIVPVAFLCKQQRCPLIYSSRGINWIPTKGSQSSGHSHMRDSNVSKADHELPRFTNLLEPKVHVEVKCLSLTRTKCMSVCKWHDFSR